MAAMQTQELNGQSDGRSIARHRARAKAELEHIVQQAKQAVAEAGLDIPLFFMIPRTGDSILTYGTPGHPQDHEWSHIGEIVCAVVAKAVGMDRTLHREIMCMASDDLE
jgi:hypothetical protein